MYMSFFGDVHLHLRRCTCIAPEMYISQRNDVHLQKEIQGVFTLKNNNLASTAPKS